MTSSRFVESRTDRNPFPVWAGLCRDCLRSIWRGTGRLPDGGCCTNDGIRCEACGSWAKVNPGKDPQFRIHGPAARIPAEWTERDPSWRERSACRGLPPSVFEPDDDEDDAQAREARRDGREYAARTVCSACPVRRECRQAADKHGYEGLWGGRSYSWTVWLDLITGERGRTIHHRRGPTKPVSTEQTEETQEVVA